MSKYGIFSFAFVLLFCPILNRAQGHDYPQIPGGKVDATVALDRGLKTSSLTFAGKPFHAIMEIGTPGEAYSGRIEVWWVNPTKYHLAVTSPQFSQGKTINGDRVHEKNDGDYYPRWLENFVLALIDPVPMAQNFQGRGGAVMLGSQINRSCLRRDDRPNGITDQMTWGELCFSGSEPHLLEVLTFNVSMNFSDWKGFDKKQVARTYVTYVLGFQPVTGHLTKLEELRKPDDAMFAVDSTTPLAQRISTTLVSTLKEESLIDKAPAIQWPPVREGKTDGYMIVYARTDKTGQVRETAKHNSDQPGLEDFGIEQALKYKFQPLVVDGVPQQMEMPLVLHFSTTTGEPIPVLSASDMARQTLSCHPNRLDPGLLPKGTLVTMRVAVSEKGDVVGVGFASGRCPIGCGLLMGPMESIYKCKFAPYSVSGHTTYYKGDIELSAP